MSVELETPPPRTPRLDDPFRIGYRTVRRTDADGGVVFDKMPLTEEDFLHPQEEDRFMLTQRHTRTVYAIACAIEVQARQGLNLGVLMEHRIDWQVGTLEPHGPDIAVFRDFPSDWDGDRGTFPVRDEGSKPLVVIEVTSEATRHTDFEAKFLEYETAGIPYYVIVDLAGPEQAPKILAFRRATKGYRAMREDPKLGYLLPDLHVWLRWEHDRAIVADEEGIDIPEPETAVERMKQSDQRLDDERRRSEAEKQRAEAEKQRADDLMRELTALKAQLAARMKETGS